MLKLIILDIDGVITDGYERIVVDETDRGFKQLCYQDLDAIQEARNAGIEFALLTAENNVMVQRIADRMAIDAVYAGFKDKAQGIQSILEARQLRAEETCFIGDSNRDARAFPLCGLSFTPANGSLQARSEATFGLHRLGGQGAIAEAIEIIFKLRRLAP